MTWTQVGMDYFSPPYRLYHNVRGYAAYFYADTGAECLDREMSLTTAKSICESHKEKAKEPA